MDQRKRRYRALSPLKTALVAFLLLAFTDTAVRSAEDEAALWQALQSGGHVALIRHALAPGNGDPAHFSIDACDTQRNLSVEGKAQASRIGARFKAHGIGSAELFSSQWCRCLETAARLDLGPVEALPLLNSFYERRERRADQTEALKAWLAKAELDRPSVLVTHQVNISALTGIATTSGELVVLRIEDDGGIRLVGSIETD